MFGCQPEPLAGATDMKSGCGTYIQLATVLLAAHLKDENPTHGNMYVLTYRSYLYHDNWNSILAYILLSSNVIQIIFAEIFDLIFSLQNKCLHFLIDFFVSQISRYFCFSSCCILNRSSFLFITTC